MDNLPFGSEQLVSSKEHGKRWTKRNCSVIDLFCGVGGMTHGFYRQGFEVAAGLDLDASCQFAYTANNPGSKFVEADLFTMSARSIADLYPPLDQKPIRVMIGCAPCQPFSTNNSKRTKSDGDDYLLVGRFADIITEVRPHIVSMENVVTLKSHKQGATLKAFLDKLKSLHYHFEVRTAKTAAYGVPQSRRRLVVLASLLGPISMIPEILSKEHFPTVRETIGHLPEIPAGGSDPMDPLHVARSLDPINLKRIQQSKPGGTWEDWEAELRAECHMRESGQSYKGVYGRMKWNEVAPTITGQFYAYGSGRFGHPTQDRALSLREGALLQTFPPNYRFVSDNDAITFIGVGTHIGNAVPVKLAEGIALSIAKHLGDES